MISIPLDYKPLSVGNVGGAVKTKLPKNLPVQCQRSIWFVCRAHTAEYTLQPDRLNGGCCFLHSSINSVCSRDLSIAKLPCWTEKHHVPEPTQIEKRPSRNPSRDSDPKMEPDKTNQSSNIGRRNKREGFFVCGHEYMHLLLRTKIGLGQYTHPHTHSPPTHR